MGASFVSGRNYLWLSQILACTTGTLGVQSGESVTTPLSLGRGVVILSLGNYKCPTHETRLFSTGNSLGKGPEVEDKISLTREGGREGGAEGERDHDISRGGG